MYLSVELVQAIANYLQKMPYKDVAVMLSEIQKADQENGAKSLEPKNDSN